MRRREARIYTLAGWWPQWMRAGRKKVGTIDTPGDNTDTASQVHWDLVNIQRKGYGGGEMHFDGKLVRKDGIFLDPKLAAINPK